MKKYFAALLITGALLTACTKEGNIIQQDMEEVTGGSVETAQEPVEEKAEEISDGTKEEGITPAETQMPEEDIIDGAVLSDFKDDMVHNDFFSAQLVEYNIPEDENEMVTIVFEFTNITDETYYKNDVEIVAGGSWEKSIFYPKDKWADKAGTESWIHYDLYKDADMQQQIYKGGLHFNFDDDLNVIDMYTFED